MGLCMGKGSPFCGLAEPKADGTHPRVGNGDRSAPNAAGGVKRV